MLKRTHFQRDARDARGAPMGAAMPAPRARPTRPARRRRCRGGGDAGLADRTGASSPPMHRPDRTITAMLAPLGLEKGKPFRSPQPEINSSAQIRMNRLFSIDIEGVDPGYRNLRVGASATERDCRNPRRNVGSIRAVFRCRFCCSFRARARVAILGDLRSNTRLELHSAASTTWD